MADYQEHLPALRAQDATVVALSTDGLEVTRDLVASLGVTFPVLNGADGPAVAARTGAYHHARGFLHATAFVLRPDGAVALSVYSSGSRGRLIATDAQVVIQNGQAQP